MAASGKKATTRVRFFWQPDISVRCRSMVSIPEKARPMKVASLRLSNGAQNQHYEFTPASGVDGPLITWTPDRPEGSDLPNHTGDNVTP